MGQVDIIWTPKARERFKEVYDYLLDEWSYKVAENFKKQVLHHTDLLATFPEMGVEVEGLGQLRKFLTSPHNFLFYRYIPNDNRVIVLDIIDTRQEPKH